MIVQGKIQNWKNDAAIRFPAPVLKAAGISSNSDIQIIATKNRLIIQPFGFINDNELESLSINFSEITDLFKYNNEELSKATDIKKQTVLNLEKEVVDIGRRLIKLETIVDLFQNPKVLKNLQQFFNP